MKKRVLSIIFAAVMAASCISGCGGGKSGSQAEESGSLEKGENVQDQSQEGSEDFRSQLPEDFAITIMLSDYEGSPNSGEYGEQIRQQIEDYTGYRLDIQWVTSDNYDDKLSTVLASGVDSMPMIMKVEASNAVIVGAAQNGAFWAIEDYLYDTDRFAYISRMMPELATAFTIDGHLYGICRKGTIGRNGMGYRTDWAEALGLDSPETVEDVYDMLYAFTYNDPDGNGVDDTYGLNLCSYTGSLDIMQTWFGCGSEWAEAEDGSLVPVHMTDEYKEALDWFKKLYDDGLITNDWPVRDTGSWRDDNCNGVAGMFVDTIDNSRRIWDYYVENEIPSVAGSDEYASMTFVPGISRTEGEEPRTLAVEQTTFFTVTKAAKTEAEMLACLDFLDKLNSDEMKLLCGYGLEGINYEISEDGMIVDLDTEDTQLQKGYAGLNQMLPNTLNAEMENYTVEKTERVLLQDEAYAEAEKIAVYNPAVAFLCGSPTYMANGGNLDLIIEDARTQYIVGQIDEKGLQDAWDLWYSSGGKEVIEEVNAQYQAK